LQRVHEPGFSELGFAQFVVTRLLEFVGQCVTLFFNSAEGFAHGKLARNIPRIEFALQLLDLRILGRGSPLQFAGGFGLGQFDGILFVLLGKLESVMQLLLELSVAYLLEDVCVSSFVNLKRFAAMRAGNFVHITVPEG
jgi:hypothetical protein